jgi:hypothetical protein
MTVSGTDRLSEQEFRQRRAHWLEIRADNLAAVLETAGPGLYRLLPSDLGDLALVAAVTVARVAADEARAQPDGRHADIGGSALADEEPNVQLIR